MKPNHSDLDAILEALEPEHIPSEFVAAGKVTYLTGRISVISKKKLEAIMDSEQPLEEQGIKEIRLLINMDVVRETIQEITENILTPKEVNQ